MPLPAGANGRNILNLKKSIHARITGRKGKTMVTDKIELFAIVELFGHNKVAGKVSEQNMGSFTFCRIDVPETPQQPAFTRFVNPSAIYAINPVT